MVCLPEQVRVGVEGDVGVGVSELAGDEEGLCKAAEMRTALLDDAAQAFLEEQGRKTAVEFDIEPREGPLPLLEWGEQPEYRALTADGRPRIFVSRHAPDWWRIRYQIAHEAFHWLCTPPRTFHWTHELFAVEMAVRAMQEIGEHEYAQTVMGELFEEAEQLSVADMLTTSLVDRRIDGHRRHDRDAGHERDKAVTR